MYSLELAGYKAAQVNGVVKIDGVLSLNVLLTPDPFLAFIGKWDFLHSGNESKSINGVSKEVTDGVSSQYYFVFSKSSEQELVITEHSHDSRSWSKDGSECVTTLTYPPGRHTNHITFRLNGLLYKEHVSSTVSYEVHKMNKKNVIRIIQTQRSDDAKVGVIITEFFMALDRTQTKMVSILKSASRDYSSFSVLDESDITEDLIERLILLHEKETQPDKWGNIFLGPTYAIKVAR